MDVHPIKNGMYRYWPIPILVFHARQMPLALQTWKFWEHLRAVSMNFNPWKRSCSLRAQGKYPEILPSICSGLLLQNAPLNGLINGALRQIILVKLWVVWTPYNQGPIIVHCNIPITFVRLVHALPLTSSSRVLSSRWRTDVPFSSYYFLGKKSQTKTTPVTNQSAVWCPQNQVFRQPQPRQCELQGPRTMGPGGLPTLGHSHRAECTLDDRPHLRRGSQGLKKTSSS